MYFKDHIEECVFVGWLEFNGTFSTNRLCIVPQKSLKFIKDVYFEWVV